MDFKINTSIYRLDYRDTSIMTWNITALGINTAKSMAIENIHVNNGYSYFLDDSRDAALTKLYLTIKGTIMLRLKSTGQFQHA